MKYIEHWTPWFIIISCNFVTWRCHRISSIAWKLYLFIKLIIKLFIKPFIKLLIKLFQCAGKRTSRLLNNYATLLHSWKSLSRKSELPEYTITKYNEFAKIAFFECLEIQFPDGIRNYHLVQHFLGVYEPTTHRGCS